MIPRKLTQLNTFRLLSLLSALCIALTLSACEGVDPQAAELTNNTKLELVDWHISGLWVINSPVAWVRVTNYNTVPVHDITFEYRASAADGRLLDHGTYTIEGVIPPGGTTKNFAELYLGLVDLYTERLSLKLLHVRRAG